MRAAIYAGIIAIVLHIGAQKITPNATPSTTAKGGSVRQLNSTQEADSAKQTKTAKPQIAPCTQASPCYIVEEPQSKTEEQKAQDASLDRLYRRYMWATIFGVFGAFIGLVILIWQTIISRAAANAALQNAQYLINSERAWINTELVLDEEASKISVVRYCVKVTNDGKTPARMLEWKVSSGCLKEDTDFSPDSLELQEGGKFHFLLGPDKSRSLRDEIPPLSMFGSFGNCLGAAAHCVTIRYADMVQVRERERMHQTSSVYYCNFLLNTVERVPEYDKYT